jgi:hypothetical protein
MSELTKVQKGQQITADMINNIIDNIRECQLQSVVGGLFRRGAGGTTITVNPSSGGGLVLTYPFEYYSGGTATAPWFGLRAGTVNGILPTNWFEYRESSLSLESFGKTSGSSPESLFSCK